jgi:hypothetical protein
MHRSRKVEYHVRVEHSPELFQDDMNFVTSDSGDAYENYSKLGDKYGRSKVKITMTTTYTRKKVISVGKLVKIALKRNNCQSNPWFSLFL